jgi:hypothetical protein
LSKSAVSAAAAAADSTVRAIMTSPFIRRRPSVELL